MRVVLCKKKNKEQKMLYNPDIVVHSFSLFFAFEFYRLFSVKPLMKKITLISEMHHSQEVVSFTAFFVYIVTMTMCNI